MRLHFLGANRQVTGSSYLLEAAGKRIVIDCGLFQEREFRGRNWAPPPYDVTTVDAMLLTHGHLDHCGLIPRLVHQGFGAPIYTTYPSVDLAELIMADCGKIQEEDAATKRRRHERTRTKGRYPEEPLYTQAQALAVMPLFRPVSYGRAIELGEGLTATFHDAGHILGSAMLEIVAHEAGQTRHIVFSGDIGQWNKPLIHDPTLLERADYIIMESTYGDREHHPNGDVEASLLKIINASYQRGGKLLVPTFAVERAQEILYHMARLREAKKMDGVQVYLDSPMAVNAVEIFDRYPEWMDAQTLAILHRGDEPIAFRGLHLCRTIEQSKALNDMQGGAIIMAGSGMCTGGRIKHHLAHHIGDERTTIMFTGYQAHGTLGREILEGRKQVRIFGEMRPIRAKITQLTGLSAHADRQGLLRWLQAFKQPPRQLFLTHGEEDAAEALLRTIKQQLGWSPVIPAYREIVDLA